MRFSAVMVTWRPTRWAAAGRPPWPSPERQADDWHRLALPSGSRAYATGAAAAHVTTWRIRFSPAILPLRNGISRRSEEPRSPVCQSLDLKGISTGAPFEEALPAFARQRCFSVVGIRRSIRISDRSLGSDGARLAGESAIFSTRHLRQLRRCGCMAFHLLARLEEERATAASS